MPSSRGSSRLVPPGKPHQPLPILMFFFGTSLQYSCLGNPMDRGAWWNTVYEVAESGMTEVTEHTAQRVLVMVI